jgi:hypothetical protein
MRADVRELALEVREAREHAAANPAAARLVARERGPVEQANGDAALGEPARCRRSGGAGTEHDHGIGRRRSGDHRQIQGNYGQSGTKRAL